MSETCDTCVNALRPSSFDQRSKGLPDGLIRCTQLMISRNEAPILNETVRAGGGFPESALPEKSTCRFTPSRYISDDFSICR